MQKNHFIQMFLMYAILVFFSCHSLIHVVDDQQRLCQILGPDLTMPKSTRLEVQVLENNEMFVTLKGKVQGDDCIPDQDQPLLEDVNLSVINNYASDESMMEYNPHRYPRCKQYIFLA